MLAVMALTVLCICLDCSIMQRVPKIVCAGTYIYFHDPYRDASVEPNNGKPFLYSEI